MFLSNVFILLIAAVTNFQVYIHKFETGNAFLSDDKFTCFTYEVILLNIKHVLITKILLLLFF